jgi:polysaccharide pyruvyl transferase WcaK-like protein
VSRLAKKFGVPYGCVGCSLGESFSFNGALWLKEFLRGSSFTIIRDPVSGARLKEFGVSQYKVFIDSAICTKDVIKIKRKPFTGNLGINTLSYVRHPRITRLDYHRYVESMKDLIIRVAGTPRLGFKRVILFNTGGAADVRASEFLYSQVKPRLSNVDVKVCRKMESLGELCYLFSQCDVVIGSRLHSGIIAKSYDIPIIGIDWDKKVAGFYEMTDLKEFCFDYKTFDVEMLINALEKIKDRNFHQDTNVVGHISELKRLPSYICQRVGVKEKV